MDLTQAKPLAENASTAFQGFTKGGAFDITANRPEIGCAQPNPNSRPNADVVRPCWNGIDVTQRPSDKWIVDFADRLSEAEATLYESPFPTFCQHVKPERDGNAEENTSEILAIQTLRAPILTTRHRALYLATSLRRKLRSIAFLSGLSRKIVPDHNLNCDRQRDDATFGFLHSRFHELWSLRLGTRSEDRPRYTLKHHLRNLPLPGRPDAARHRPRRRSGFAALRPARSSPKTSPPPPAASTNCAKPGSTRPSGLTGSSPRKRKKPASPNARSPNPATKPTSRSAP